MSLSRRDIWARRIARYRRTELTVKEFCQREGVSQPSFYQWKRTLAEDRPVGLPTFLPVRVVASCCHAHARRKFEAAKGNDPKRAAYALSFYRQLFDIEDACADLAPEARLAQRAEQSVPIMERFKAWLDEQRGDGSVLPKSAIGKAIRYALNQWQPLSVYLTAC